MRDSWRTDSNATTTEAKNNCRLSRRAFIRQGSLLLAGPMLVGGEIAFSAISDVSMAAPLVRIGLVTDLHFADRPAAGTRYYRESLTKLAEAVKRFEQDKTDLVVELGDLIDSTESLEAEKEFLRKVVNGFAAAPGAHHYVIGNHCVYMLTKPEYLKAVGQEKTYYSFVFNEHHFIVLDACYRRDGTPYGQKNYDWTDANLPPAELDWLQADLKATPHKTVVFVHQRLDVSDECGVNRAPEIRKILEQSGKVIAVLQGHYHANDYREINGIHYCTLAAMIEGTGKENNAYARMDILPDGIIRIAGFRKQQSHEWK